MMPRIYCDHAATTPLRPEARAAMEPFLAGAFGNPSSLHADGQAAKRVLDRAREEVSSAIGAQFAEISFTGGGTESDNAAILGVLWGANRQRGHLITTLMEHEAVLHTARFCERQGFPVTYLTPDTQGRVYPQQVKDALRPDTALVSVMHANNEVGTINNIAALAGVCHAHNTLLHTDAVQSFGKLSTNVQDLGADLCTVSAHKVGGPKGVGALYVRSGVAMEPFLHGGAQERERRAGTENVAAIAGFGVAARLAASERAGFSAWVSTLRDGFWQRVCERFPHAVRNGDSENCLPGLVNFSLPGLDAEALLIALDGAGVSASSGSACTSGSIEPSHVLTAMGLDGARVHSALRFSFGSANAEGDGARAADILAGIASRMGMR